VRWISFPQLPTHLVSGKAWHHHIEHNEIEMLSLLDQFQCFESTLGLRNGVVLQRQVICKNLQVDWFIVDNEDAMLSSPCARVGGD